MSGKLGKARIHFGTSKNTTAAGNAIRVLTDANINSVFGINNANNTNTIVLFANGDANSVSAHIDGSSYQSGNWYAVLDRSVSGGIRYRINYLIIYDTKND